MLRFLHQKDNLTYRGTAVLGVMQNVAYLEKQQHMWHWRHSNCILQSCKKA